MYPTIFSTLANSALFFWSMLSNIVSLISVSRKISHNKVIFQTHDLLLCWLSIQSSSFGHRPFNWTSFLLLFAFLKSWMWNFIPNCCLSFYQIVKEWETSQLPVRFEPSTLGTVVLCSSTWANFLCRQLEWGETWWSFEPTSEKPNWSWWTVTWSQPL